jgi:katanin p60 ATPase-containing subunit A1
MVRVELSAQLWNAYQKALAKAQQCLENGQLHAAAQGYREASAYLRKYASFLQDTKAKNMWRDRANTYEAWAERLEAGEYPQPATHNVTESSPAQEKDFSSEIESMIVPRDKLSVDWDDIGGLEETKKQIKLAYGLSVAQPPTGVQLPLWRGLLLYGPPGTGKTLLAAAIAKGLDATFFQASAAQLLSKWFGESSKIISALYQVARERQPSVICLDEVEALTPPRGEDESGAERRVVNAFLTEMDGLQDKGVQYRVLTVGITNMPWLVDRAVLRRFEKKIYVPLPDAQARYAILDIFLRKRGHQTDVPLEWLVERTEGFSGAELERLCKEAITLMIERMNPSLVKLVDLGRDALEQYQIQVRPITKAEWEEAFRRTPPETPPALLERYETWRKQAI